MDFEHRLPLAPIDGYATKQLAVGNRGKYTICAIEVTLLDVTICAIEITSAPGCHAFTAVRIPIYRSIRRSWHVVATSDVFAHHSRCGDDTGDLATAQSLIGEVALVFAHRRCDLATTQSLVGDVAVIDADDALNVIKGYYGYLANQQLICVRCTAVR